MVSSAMTFVYHHRKKTLNMKPVLKSWLEDYLASARGTTFYINILLIYKRRILFDVREPSGPKVLIHFDDHLQD